MFKIKAFSSISLIALPSILSLVFLVSACDVNNNKKSSHHSMAITCENGNFLFAGSTAQHLSMDKWIQNYRLPCRGSNVIDGGGGSGLGITQFTNKATDMAGSDYPVTDKAQLDALNKRCAPGHVLNIPMVISSISINFNINGVQHLTLDAQTLALIFNGTIKNWNDPSIQQMNKKVTLPDLPIRAVYRSDASGTTYNFTNYLNKNAPNIWKTTANKVFPLNTTPGSQLQGATGSNGVVQNVSMNNGSIGYVETSYVAEKKFKVAFIMSNNNRSSSGKDLKSVENFIEENTVVNSSDSGLIVDVDFNKKSEKSTYPLAMITYEVVCSSNANKLVKSFLTYTASKNAQEDQPFGYIPLTANIQKKVEETIKTLN